MIMNNDLISREALKKKFERLVDETIPYGRVAVNDMRELIDNAPSVEPLERIGSICEENCGYRPQGEWGKIGEIGLAYKCNKCDEVSVIPTNFCPNCGAKMKGGAE